MEHFFIVGAQRSGTTYLYEMLKQHPKINMAQPVKPEPKYFMEHNQDNLNYHNYIDSFFSSRMQGQILGEKSTSYYEYESSARLISSTVPKAKIIFLLRNPIYRALSNYYFSVENGLETRKLTDVFCEGAIIKAQPDNISTNPYNYLGRGEYYKFINLYKKYFGDSQIKIVIFEELLSSTKDIAELYDFLCVDSGFEPKQLEKINQSKVKKEEDLDVLQFLASYYEPFNNELAKLMGRDGHIWK